MDYDEFREKHCRMCGSFYCPGDDDAIKTCGKNPDCEDELPKILAAIPKAKRTQGDKIRAMSDEELYEFLREVYKAGESDQCAYEWGHRKNSFEWDMNWLQAPADEGGMGDAE